MAYWLDELPPQAVLDGLEPFDPSKCSNLELCPDIFPAVLPTYVSSLEYSLEYTEYELSVLRELGYDV